MKEYIEREAVNQIIAAQCGECADACLEFDGIQPDCNQCLLHGEKKDIESIPAADVRPLVVCANCEHNNHCLTQEFLDDCGKIPLDRSTFFCADGERRNNV